MLLLSLVVDVRRVGIRSRQQDCRQSGGDKGFNTVEFLLYMIFIESDRFNEKETD